MGAEKIEKVEQVGAKSIEVYHPCGLVTSKLIERLKAGNTGDIITDFELTGICGKDTRSGKAGYNALCRAIHHTLKHYGICWQRVRKENLIKCSNNAEKMQAAQSCVHSAGKSTKKSLEYSSTVDIDTLTPEQRSQFLVTTAQAGMIHHLTTRKVQKKMLSQKMYEPVSPEKLLAALTLAKPEDQEEVSS